MAWLAVETNGNEYIYTYEPYRDNICGKPLIGWRVRG